MKYRQESHSQESNIDTLFLVEDISRRLGEKGGK